MNARALPVGDRDVAGIALEHCFGEPRFRHALGRFATGVAVISSGSGESLHAMTANAFISSSLKPPLSDGESPRVVRNCLCRTLHAGPHIQPKRTHG
ncbi:hypothetical protein C9I56_02665 [Paraburkholderia caribensis]|uniref:flavin reductase n=1 Tax=Paraburkholderia caribensis TaxID=75105 RepID=UPI000D42FD46|nr:hypothetical protein C9I56_02665 [Paraburkholderia caribensis]